MTAEAFCRELNRRERILDFVCEPPRHLTPRRDLLRSNQRRHIVEHEHDTFRRADVAGKRRHDDGKMQLLTFARDGNFLDAQLGFAASGGGEQLPDGLEVGTTL